MPQFFFLYFWVFFCGNCARHTGRLEQHALAPKFKAVVASRLWAVKLRPIFLSFPFFFFLLSFSFNSSFLLHSSGDCTAKLFPSISVTCRNDIFFSSFPQPSSFCSCVSNLWDPAENGCYHLTWNTRGVTDTLPQQHPWISRSVKSNVNKPAPWSSICHFRAHV
jgi:hypothetical protein